MTIIDELIECFEKVNPEYLYIYEEYFLHHKHSIFYVFYIESFLSKEINMVNIDRKYFNNAIEFGKKANPNVIFLTKKNIKEFNHLYFKNSETDAFRNTCKILFEFHFGITL